MASAIYGHVRAFALDPRRMVPLGAQRRARRPPGDRLGSGSRRDGLLQRHVRATFEPFWDQCGALLVSMDMGGMDEMDCECRRAYAAPCSDVPHTARACCLPRRRLVPLALYPPGSAAPTATSPHMTAVH